MTKQQSFKIQLSNWINTETQAHEWGIQVKLEGDQWRHVAEDGGILIFPDIGPAMKKMEEVREQLTEFHKPTDNK
jgi:hypothetical protein